MHQPTDSCAKDTLYIPVVEVKCSVTFADAEGPVSTGSWSTVTLLTASTSAWESFVN